VRVKISATALVTCGWMVWASATFPWQKDFAEWTEKDANTVVTNSPWAKQMTMPIGQRPEITVLEPGENADVHAPDAAATRAGAPNAKPAVPLRNGTGAPAMQPLATILWASAMPVRLAILKLHAGAATPTAEQIANATKPRSHYVIAVSGFPAPEGGSDPKALAGGAFLSIHGKAPVVAVDSDYRKIGSSDVYFFRFARESLDIAASDQQVEFRVTLGKTEIKKKFELSGMLYQGQLAL
jgi:hypothetical protein